MAKRKALNLKNSVKGTGNLLKDLISTTVLIKKLKLSCPCSSLIVSENVVDLCSVCNGEEDVVETITECEMNMLNELVLKSWPVEIFTAGLEFVKICRFCSQLLKRLEQCRKDMEDIVLSVRTVIRMQIKGGGEKSNDGDGGIHTVPYSYMSTAKDPSVGCDSHIEAIATEANDDGRSDSMTQRQKTPTVLMEFELTDDEADNVKVEEDIADNKETAVVGAVSSTSTADEATTNEGTIVSPVKKVDSLNNASKPTCDECGKTFSRECHLRRHRNNKNVHNRQAKKQFECVNCEKSFFSMEMLHNHKENCDQDLKPVVLNLEFDIENDDELENVQRDFVHVPDLPAQITEDVENQGDTKYQEDSVDPTTINQDLQMATTIVRTPTPTVINTELDKPKKTRAKRVKCTCPNCTDDSVRSTKHLCHISGCGKVYGRTSHLRAHLRWHVGEKPFPCLWTNCGKRFTRSDELTRHRMTHTGEKRFECRKCGMMFWRSDHLTQHMKKAHSNGKQSVGRSFIRRGKFEPLENTEITSIHEDVSLINVPTTDVKEGGADPLENLSTQECVHVEKMAKRQCRARAEELLRQSLATTENANDSEEDDDSDGDDSDTDYQDLDEAISDSADDLDSIAEDVVITDVEINDSETLHKDPLDATKHQITDHDEPMATTSAHNRGTVAAMAINTYRRDKRKKTKLKRVPCTCPNCTRIDASNKREPKKSHSCHIPDCGKVYRKTSHLVAHLRWHTGEKPFPCLWTNCGKRFTRADELSRHRITHSAGDKRFQCPKCLKKFGRSDHLSKHVKTHSNPPPEFKCDDCDKVFNRAASLRKHSTLIHDNSTYICEKCGKEYSKLIYLRYHQRSCKGPKNPKRMIDAKDNPFPCKICGKRYADKRGVFEHVRVFHKGHRYKCDECPKHFRSSAGLKTHKTSTHSKIKIKRKSKRDTFQCEMCSTILIGKSRMVRHVELVHSIQQDACPYGCPDKIDSKKEWITHLEQCKSEKITEESKCKCFFCGELFSNQLLRISHHLDVHTTISCEFCSRTFTATHVRDYHLYSHEEATPHLCPKCGKRFKQLYNLQVHSKTICGDDEDAKQDLIIKRREQNRISRSKEKSHKCDICLKAFVEERRLNAHKLKKHNMDKDNDSTEDEIEDDAI